MKRRLQNLALLVLAAGCLFFLWRHFFPDDESRVRRCLSELAQVASVPNNPTPAWALLTGDHLRRLLAEDVVLDVEIPELGRETRIGRQEIVTQAVAALELLKGLKVELVDVQVTLAPDRASATSDLTAKARLSGDKDFFYQELKIQLKQEDRQWRVSRVETVRVLKL